MEIDKNLGGGVFVYIAAAISALGIAVLLSATTAEACTTWASIGKRNEKGGLLIAKNRDSVAREERLILTAPRGGYKYVGIMYNDKGSKDYPQMSAGMNEKGVVVVNSAAASVPPGGNNNDTGQTWPMVQILRGYDSVDAVIKDQKKLFATSFANNLLIGDRNKILLVEIGENGKYALEEKSEGILFHTNNYVSKKLLYQNTIDNPDSMVRYKRIRYLLESHEGPYSFNFFWKCSNDRHDGLEDSIFRAWTIATWIVSIPEKELPFLYVRFTSPVVNYTTFRITPDEAFWKQRGVIKSKWLSELPPPPSVPRIEDPGKKRAGVEKSK